MASLRKMTDKDLSVIMVLEEKFFKGGAWYEDDYLYELHDDPFAYYTVIEMDGMIVGYAGCRCVYENGEIMTIGVDKAYQKQHLGSMLLEDLLDHAIKQNCENMTLEVRVSNHPAISLYEKYGFKKAALRKKYYSDGEDAYLMMKELEGSK